MSRLLRSIVQYSMAAVFLLLVVAPLSAQVSSKKTPEMYFLYREHLGPYSRVLKALEEVNAFMAEKELDGPLIAIYFDNPARTAPSLQRSELGVRISLERALEILKEARPDDAEESLKAEIETERGAFLSDPYHVRKMSSKLVATRTVTAPFSKIYESYTPIQKWIWQNGYFLVGPVTEIYMSPIRRDREVRAEIQIGIKRTGVPDRR